MSSPSVRVPAPIGPIRVKHDTAIQKRATATSQGGQGAGNEGSMSEGSEVHRDEDDVMLFSFWGNSKAKACSEPGAHNVRGGLEG